MERRELLGLNKKELEWIATSHGESAYRGRQMASWIYGKYARSMDEMSDIPAKLREVLKEKASIERLNVEKIEKDTEGTAKYLLRLSDSNLIESVLIPYANRVSVCVSTQVGCPVGCVFCATGGCGFTRNLTSGEIVDEVLTLQSDSKRRISHVVYMGMGEPLLNYDETLKSIHLLNEEAGISMRHITVSTVGITPRIDQLAGEKLQITLAVSLHAADDVTRERIIPTAVRHRLKGLMNTCRMYTDSTGRRITFEYMLIDGVNDSNSQAHELAGMLRGMLCAVNLIPYNEVEGLPYRRSSSQRIKAFRSILEDSGISVTKREERGHSLSAACGQLSAGKNKKAPRSESGRFSSFRRKWE